ncbi:MAG: TMEM165/GDT1 family protein [Methanothrix sp.]|nr:TMEM165/GDT1 family protein [Methanothrix sp.]
MFILFGILTLLGDRDDEVESNLSAKRAFVSGFSMIFLSEWGDKTQIASAIFATEYNPRMVFIGVMIALLILSVMAVFLGKYISCRIDRRVIARVGGVVFLLIGLSFLLAAVTSAAFVDML